MKTKLRRKAYTLARYIETFFELIRYCAESGEAETLTGTQMWYLYRQFFYGFGEPGLSDFRCRVLCSKRARSIYRGLGGERILRKALEKLAWFEQAKVDEGRKRLIREHMYTGSEFRADISKLHADGALSVAAIERLVRKKYVIAWIAREEDAKLPKSKRPRGAMVEYAAAGIELMA